MKCLQRSALVLCILTVSVYGMGRGRPIRSGKPYYGRHGAQQRNVAQPAAVPQRRLGMVGAATPVPAVAASDRGWSDSQPAYRAPQATSPQHRMQGSGAAVMAAAATPIRGSADELPLPESLRNLRGVQVRHIVVERQGPNQCGSRSVANALAVQDLVMRGEELNSSSIRYCASRYHGILIDRVLEWTEVADLARRNNLYNAHLMGRMPRDCSSYMIGSVEQNTHSLNELAESLLIEGDMTAHIICNTGGHWVLVSIIKLSERTPQILYMDSCNGTLHDDSVAVGYIRYLYNLCFE